MISIHETRFAKALDPVANAFAGTVHSDVFNVSQAHKITFLVYKGVGTTGTTTITVLASDDNSPTTTTAVPFRYRRLNNSDVPGAVAEATAAGFTTTAGSSDLYEIELDCKAMANTGYMFASLLMTESNASAVVGCVLAMIVPRYADSTQTITS